MGFGRLPFEFPILPKKAEYGATTIQSRSVYVGSMFSLWPWVVAFGGLQRVVLLCVPLFISILWVSPVVLWKKAPRTVRAMRGKALEAVHFTVVFLLAGGVIFWVWQFQALLCP